MTTAVQQYNGVLVTAHDVARDLVLWALAVAGAEQAERITRMRLCLGEGVRVAPDELEYVVRLFTRRTIAEGAEVEVRITNEQHGVFIEGITFE
jgi:Zn finger protein HypA/HybF involved in hydrogenase expression